MAKREGNLLSGFTVSDYLDTTGSDAPVPGGGCAAALCAALAAALGEMVANLTVGREKYRENEAEMIRFREKLSLCRKKMELHIDRDKQAYEKVLAAYKISRDAAHESLRKNAIQIALKEAAIVPAEVANDAVQILFLIDKVIKKGNRNALTDGITGALLARSAALAALLNVKVNLSAIHDAAFKETIEQEVEELEQKAIQAEGGILAWYRSLQ
jgi:formiminotetrahydrofolate cyclodeaminase